MSCCSYILFNYRLSIFNFPFPFGDPSSILLRSFFETSTNDSKSLFYINATKLTENQSNSQRCQPSLLRPYYSISLHTIRGHSRGSGTYCQNAYQRKVMGRHTLAVSPRFLVLYQNITAHFLACNKQYFVIVRGSEFLGYLFRLLRYLFQEPPLSN